MNIQISAQYWITFMIKSGELKGMTIGDIKFLSMQVLYNVLQPPALLEV